MIIIFSFRQCPRALFIQNEKVDTIRRIPLNLIQSILLPCVFSIEYELPNYHLLSNYYTLCYGIIYTLLLLCSPSDNVSYMFHPDMKRILQYCISLSLSTSMISSIYHSEPQISHFFLKAPRTFDQESVSSWVRCTSRAPEGSKQPHKNFTRCYYVSRTRYGALAYLSFAKLD